MRLKFSIVLLLASELSCATNITTLLNAIDKRPQSRLEQIDVNRASLGVNKVTDMMMPKLDGFVGYEMYNRPSALRAILPSEMKNPNAPLLFSKKIRRAGVRFSWPIFVKLLYTLKEKTELMHLASKDKKRLSRIQREAKLVGSVAYLRYMESMFKALKAKEYSILATRKKISLMVKSGRAPQSNLMTLDAKIDELKMNTIAIEEQKSKLEATIETLTGISLKHSVGLHQRRGVRKGTIFALAPLKKTLRAEHKGIKVAKERYYPTVALKGSYTLSQADAYNDDKSVHSGYGSLGVYVNVPLYDSSHSTGVQEAKLNYLKTKSLMAETKDRLKVEAKELRREIKLIKRSKKLARRNIANQKALLKIAKVSLVNEMITEEEYLRYEDALASAKAILYQNEAKEWQDIAQLAVIYGNDLKRIVK